MACVGAVVDAKRYRQKIHRIQLTYFWSRAVQVCMHHIVRVRKRIAPAADFENVEKFLHLYAVKPINIKYVYSGLAICARDADALLHHYWLLAF